MDDNNGNEGNGNRDEAGRFAPGNSCGVDTRFPPGVAQNPGGQAGGPSANAMTHIRQIGDIPTAELERMRDNETLSDSRRVAAHIRLLQRHPDPKVALAAFGEVTDRLEGKSTQRIQVQPLTGGEMSVGEMYEHIESQIPGCIKSERDRRIAIVRQFDLGNLIEKVPGELKDIERYPAAASGEESPYETICHDLLYRIDNHKVMQMLESQGSQQALPSPE